MNPDSFYFLSLVCRDLPLSMHLALLPESFVAGTVLPQELSISIEFVEDEFTCSTKSMSDSSDLLPPPLTCVFLAIWPDELTVTMHFVSTPLPDVGFASCPNTFALSFDEIFLELSCEGIHFPNRVLSITMHLPIHVLPFVPHTLARYFLAFPTLQSTFPASAWSDTPRQPLPSRLM